MTLTKHSDNTQLRIAYIVVDRALTWDVGEPGSVVFHILGEDSKHQSIVCSWMDALVSLSVSHFDQDSILDLRNLHIESLIKTDMFL